MLRCAISGETPVEPVVSGKSGHVFERRLIEKYVEAHGQCPVTGEELSLDDLLVVQSAVSEVKPRPPTASSVPGMLSLFQNEWDSLMLETFTLKQQLGTVRQELSHALYQHDAACRVIARLIRERDQARTALSEPSASDETQQPVESENVVNEGDGMEVEQEQSVRLGMSEEILGKITETSNKLRKSRKGRRVSSTLAKPEDFEQLEASGTVQVHEEGNVISMDLHPSKPYLIASGSANGSLNVFSRTNEKIVSTTDGHKDAVVAVQFHPQYDILMSASVDKTATIWKADDGRYTVAHVISTHDSPLCGISFQPTGDYFATAAVDSTWGFHDLATGACLTLVRDESDSYETMKFHPDGLILGTGTRGGNVRIWDLKSQSVAATLESASQSKINSLSFSENGYYMAAACGNASAHIWDLRKLKIVETLLMEDNSKANSVAFDYSGRFVGLAGSVLKIHSGTKGFAHLKTLSAGSEIFCMSFGEDSKVVAAGSSGGQIQFFTL